MNPTTLKEFNAICDKATKDILQAKINGGAADAIHFSVMIEMMTLILIRIDEIEASLGTQQ